VDRLEVHELIIATERFWYGAVLDAPKVYDADTKHHSDRLTKGSSEASAPARWQGTPEFTPQVEAWIRELAEG
jgi:hypothetical protein